MNLDPVYLQAALVAAGLAVLFGPELVKLVSKVKLPAKKKKVISDVEAFLALALVRDYLGDYSGSEELDAIETLCTAVVLKGGEEHDA